MQWMAEYENRNIVPEVFNRCGGIFLRMNTLA